MIPSWPFRDLRAERTDDTNDGTVKKSDIQYTATICFIIDNFRGIIIANSYDSCEMCRK